MKLIVVLLFGLLLAGCAVNNHAPATTPVVRATVTAVATVEHYPAVTEQTFTDACVKAMSGVSGATAQRRCLCLLTRLERRYALADFLRLQDNLSAGIPVPPEVMADVNACR